MNDRPQFNQIDAWGLTHQGKVRPENQDHFFVGALVRGVSVAATSVSDESTPILHPERLASLAIVADGVGSTEGGGEAARIAVSGLLASVSRFFHDADRAEAEDPDVFSRLLNEAALACHQSLLVKSQKEENGRRFATTVTLFLGLWPHAYLLQVGDSRCYVYRDGRLTQITRDQTIAQELVDSGVLTRDAAERTRWANVLSSSIGGPEAAPVITRVVREQGTVVLLCSDGLTKHVPDDAIASRLAAMTSSRQVAEQLVQDALDGGGRDNITVVVGRTIPPR
jgi:serine/threonine protein phosphatase PrpC